MSIMATRCQVGETGEAERQYTQSDTGTREYNMLSEVRLQAHVVWTKDHVFVWLSRIAVLVYLTTSSSS